MIPCRPANKTTSNWSSVESHCRCQLAASAQLKMTAMPNSNDRWYWRYWWWWPWFIIKLWIALQTVTGKSAKNYERPMLRLSHLPNTLQGLHEKKIYPKHISQDSCNFIRSQCVLDYSVIGVFHDCRISFIPESAHSVPTRGSCAYVNIGFTSLWLDTLPPPVITSQL